LPNGHIDPNAFANGHSFKPFVPVKPNAAGIKVGTTILGPIVHAQQHIASQIPEKPFAGEQRGKFAPQVGNQAGRRTHFTERHTNSHDGPPSL
jgi:hypothetical protein